MASCFYILKKIYKTTLCNKLNTTHIPTILNDKSSSLQMFENHSINDKQDINERKFSYLYFFKITGTLGTFDLYCFFAI